jgi:hypothetical protein
MKRLDIFLNSTAKTEEHRTNLNTELLREPCVGYPAVKTVGRGKRAVVKFQVRKEGLRPLFVDYLSSMKIIPNLQPPLR